MKIRTKQNVARLGVLCLAVLLTAPAPAKGQEQTDERSPYTCVRDRPLPACAGFLMWEAHGSPSVVSGTRDVTFSPGSIFHRKSVQPLMDWNPGDIANLGERGGSWGNRGSLVPRKYGSFPSQPVAFGLRQGNQQGAFPTELLSLGGGVAGSWLVGLPVFYVLHQIAGDRRVKGDAGYSPTANWGLLVSSSIGAATGVHLVERGLGETTSMKGALMGSLLGTLPLVLGVDSPYLPYFAFTVGSVLQAAGGLLGSR